MTKTYTLHHLGCANCAAKMEREICALPGVKGCSISFMSTRMRLEVEDAQLPAIEKAAAKIIRRIEPRTVLAL